MHRYALTLGLVLLGTCAPARAAGTAGSEHGAERARSSLPEVLAELPQGTITAKDLRSAVEREATANPGRFGLGESFLQHTMIVMEAVKQGVQTPDGARIQTRVDRQEAETRGFRSLDEQLAAAGLTRADLRRMVREGLLLEAIARRRLGLPAGAEVDAPELRRVYRELQGAYNPVFHGVGHGKRAATVGGIHFSADEVVDYLLQWGRDRALSRVLEEMLTTRLILDHAQQQGIDTVGLDAEQALAELLAPRLAPAELETYYEKVRPDLAIIRASWILCAFNARPDPRERSRPVTPEARTRARLRAEAIYDHLQEETIAFAEAARKYSDAGDASRGGDLGYLADALDIGLNLPPQAYALDYVRTPRGLRSPLAAPPDARVLKTARQLVAGAFSRPLETRAGFAIVQRTGARLPRKRDLMLRFLKRRRFLELREALIGSLREEVTFRWRPSNREKHAASETGTAAARALESPAAVRP